MPRVFVCNDTSDYLQYVLNEDGTTNFTQQYGVCASGQGDWIQVESLRGGGSGPGTAGAVTPEQAAVQIAILGVGAMAALKGMALGLMR